MEETHHVIGKIYRSSGERTARPACAGAPPKPVMCDGARRLAIVGNQRVAEANRRRIILRDVTDDFREIALAARRET
jgi:hypothetical protein